MWPDVALVLAGAIGAAVSGGVASLFNDRMEHRAFRRGRLAAWIDRDRELLGEYLLAVDDLTSALIEWVDEFIPPIREPSDDEIGMRVIETRRQHERLWHQAALRVPDNIAGPLIGVQEALASYYEWAHDIASVLTDESRDAHTDAVHRAVENLISTARVGYGEAEEKAGLM